MGQEEKCAAPAMVAGGALSSWPAMQQHHAADYFALSCALAVLHHSGVRGGCDLGDGWCRWSRRREIALRKRVGELESEVKELRRRRVEDARANEKVAGIFATHEQRWFVERKGLRRQVHAVVAAARAREVTHEGVVVELRRQLEEQQRAVGLKDEAMEQEVRGREEAEEKLRASEQAAEDVRERARKDAQEHAAELRKHKAAFVELASAQRQLGAELARAARRGDSAEAELKEALERRDEAAATAAELSSEAARLRRDAEHKDKILSAMLRKSKIDMDDREMLVREVKMCKARRKQAELEADRWRKMWESRHRRGSRSSARCAAADHPGCSDKLTAADSVACGNDTKILFVDHVVESDGKKGWQTTAPAPKDPSTVECVDRYPSHVDDKPVVEEYQDLQEWFKMETEKYTSMIRHRHNVEVEAFTEQLRLKDEKLEAFRWRAASMDVEASRLRCRVQELEARLSEQEERSAALEALLVDRDDENSSLKEQLAASQARSIDGTEICTADGDGGCEHRVPCSPEGVAAIKLIELVSPDDAKNEASAMEATEAVDVVSVQNDASAASPDELVEHEQPPVAQARVPYTCEIEEEEEEKEVCIDPENARPRDSTDRPEVTSSSSELALALVVAAPSEQRTSACKLDIQALAVSYKIKRLKQQLLVLEKLAAAAGGKETATATKPSNDATDAASGCGRQQYPRIYHIMVSFLSKHVKRYQSLDDKIDDLCTRMEESKRGGEREQWRRQESEGSRDQSAALGHFLEETFQLQRYMVATGQKLLEMQSRIAPTLSRAAAAGSGDDGVDMGRFMDIIGALLRDVQRGLEVRIARIIGDLEGTLTFHGILHTTF
ncbi:hypothetical protein GUJ93_ZPchr0008g12947 [Zizania palustris]|uniref:Uncharacterized protein n=1 Tax=Zizania palustris TaxID=103762 RepID=A0A8J5R3H6_ZIZPA|nr:hypothetical protein GUJ93_ZPchr0008g12947 [Zizania palustris]